MSSMQVVENYFKDKKNGQEIRIKEIRVSGPEGDLHHRSVRGAKGSQEFAIDNIAIKSKDPLLTRAFNNGIFRLVLGIVFLFLLDYLTNWAPSLKIVLGVCIVVWMIALVVTFLAWIKGDSATSSRPTAQYYLT
ncbi:PREDICTED: uncharacterized protein LOC109586857 [Amphimedon queenslandica]|uniref:Uncharacterized protein n=2 Tax=Amphimedon queenslandica TaxID=400682 RepID=A0AAN0JPB9_AMPQE|nr:PREDICTED: uncharacterized protein LOC109586857 [Amphimedon queenslandica]|eukprot:XP_019858645.1 PREDICTED: uncharacterized protein LOC109586857 [Amphimedon queenslandica]